MIWQGRAPVKAVRDQNSRREFSFRIRDLENYKNSGLTREFSSESRIPGERIEISSCLGNNWEEKSGVVLTLWIARPRWLSAFLSTTPGSMGVSNTTLCSISIMIVKIVRGSD